MPLPVYLLGGLLGLILLGSVGRYIFKLFAVYIPNNRIGIDEIRVGRRIEKGFIALNGEAGYQPKILRGGWYFINPIFRTIHIAEFVTIPQGKIGYIFARDGAQLGPSETLASNLKAKDFRDPVDFFAAGGQMGPQRRILREGTYDINLSQFIVITEEKVYSLPMSPAEESVINNMATEIAARDGFRPVVIKDSDDRVGIVTVHDGPSMPPGELIAPIVGNDPGDKATFHNNFQDPDAFLEAGGMRGRQLQVIAEGTYYINRLFATVEMLPKTVVEVGQVGVVVSYTGEKSEDLSGVEYKHGELVTKGCRGVWSEALLPGKYAFNTYAGKVLLVPTTNIILKWLRNETGAHKFDENLHEISLITKDAFEPSLPLSVVVHIDYRKAPLVVQRFGDIKRLVEQTLDPMVSAYFKNIGQTRTLIQLLQDRATIQQIAGQEMKEKFARYNLELEEVLIGTPTSSVGDNQIENILTQLRSRQIAEEQVETYAQQEKAAEKERELREAEAKARQQQVLTESELSITVSMNKGKAEYQKSIQKANEIKALAEVEGEKTRIMGEAESQRYRMMAEAEADKIARVGLANAIAIEEQVHAYGGPKFQVLQHVMGRFADAIQASGVDVVPKIIFGGSGNGSEGKTGSILEGLLSILLSERLDSQLKTIEGSRTRDAGMDALKARIKKEISTAPPPKEPARTTAAMVTTPTAASTATTAVSTAEKPAAPPIANAAAPVQKDKG